MWPGGLVLLVKHSIRESKIELNGSVRAAGAYREGLRRRLAEVFPARGARKAMLRKLGRWLVRRRGRTEELNRAASAMQYVGRSMGTAGWGGSVMDKEN